MRSAWLRRSLAAFCAALCFSACTSSAGQAEDINAILNILSMWQQAGNAASVPYQWPNGWTLGEYLVYFFDTTGSGLPTFSQQLRNVLGPLYNLTNNAGRVRLDVVPLPTAWTNYYDMSTFVATGDGNALAVHDSSVVSSVDDVLHALTDRSTYGSAGDQFLTHDTDILDYLQSIDLAAMNNGLWAIDATVSNSVESLISTNADLLAAAPSPDEDAYDSQRSGEELSAREEALDWDDVTAQYNGEEDDNLIADWDFSTWLPGSTDPLDNLARRITTSDFQTQHSVFDVISEPITCRSMTVRPFSFSVGSSGVWAKAEPRLRAAKPFFQSFWTFLGFFLGFAIVKREWHFYTATAGSGSAGASSHDGDD